MAEDEELVDFIPLELKKGSFNPSKAGMKGIWLSDDVKNALKRFKGEEHQSSFDNVFRSLLNFWYTQKEILRETDEMRKDRIVDRVAHLEERFNDMEKSIDAFTKILREIKTKVG